ncbi:hypothetical protein VFPFJ_08116 [Purpureocillium lilacinum]|uniref:Uncharacterized protein n=1 Tax=Purpureocillium lilacinum TaxID=33203 RepID=A0A179H6E3_PURLI|nr:hypothetical protein VFPFJ_08116 [Purpureocillium lilacinum]OAQ85727.1 hypothetical protein VFPFJ_08116 [Purpureocillium lilacinum]
MEGYYRWWSLVTRSPSAGPGPSTLVLPVLVRSSAARAGQAWLGFFQGVMRAGLVAYSRLQRIRTVADARFVHCASQPGRVGCYVGRGQPRLDGMRRSET